MAERSFLPVEPVTQNGSDLLAAKPIRTREQAITSAGSCRLLLPPVVYAAAGQETNIYFDNIVLSAVPGRYLFDVACEKGMQHEKRWHWTPGDEAGEYPLQIEIRDRDDTVLTRRSTVIRVAEQSSAALNPFKLLCIGDSLTAASVYTGELLNLFDGDSSPQVALLGTQHREPFPPENRSEGYSGWRFDSFTSQWQPDAPPDALPNSQSSPFLFRENGKPTLSVARYLDEKLEGVRPDFITVFLGINDLFLATDKTRQYIVDAMIGHAEALIDSIRCGAPEAAIGIVTPTPPSVSQDSFGETNGNLQTRWGYRKNLWLGLVRLMQVFGEREAENIHIVPAYVNLDCENNFPMVERQANARNPMKVKIVNNEVHPAEPGYYQIADSIYGWIKSQLEKNDG